MDAIFRRRSIRRYTDQDIPEELLKKILDAGMNAPSAGNEQPWQFIVIKNKGALNKLADCSPYARAVKGAPLGIIICGDLSLERHPGYWVQDCSAATENILIEVAALDLGAVWLGVYPMEDRVEYIKRQFGLPQHIVPFSIVPIGYPADEAKAVERYNEARVHREKW